MRLNRLDIFKFINIVIIIVCLIIGLIASFDAEKYINKDVFYVAPIVSDNKYYFTADELKELAVLPVRLASISLDRAAVNFSAYAQIIYTNSDCFALNNSRFVRGGPWASDQDNVIIINESLAWQVFGSPDVLNSTVDLADKNYTIIGVTKEERVSGDNCVAYLPFASFSGQREVSSIFIEFLEYDRLRPADDLKSWLRAINKDPRDYYLTDLNRYLENIGNKYKILLVLIGLYIIAVLIINSYKLLKNRHGRNRKLPQLILMISALLALDLLFIIILLKGLSLDIWIPHTAGGRMTEVIRTILGTDFLPAKEYLLPNLARIARLNANANMALTLGAVALFNFVFLHNSRVVE